MGPSGGTEDGKRPVFSTPPISSFTVCSMQCAEGFDPALVSITVQDVEGTCLCVNCFVVGTGSTRMHIIAMHHPFSLM